MKPFIWEPIPRPSSVTRGRTIWYALRTMRSPPQLALTLWLIPCFCFEGCGTYFVGFVSNPAGSQTISGTVSTVQLTSTRDITGETIILTAVTFMNSATATTINFCGDQRKEFSADQEVQVEFNTGVYCSRLWTVVVVT